MPRYSATEWSSVWFAVCPARTAAMNSWISSSLESFDKRIVSVLESFHDQIVALLEDDVKAIEASELRKTYRGGVRALDGCSFEVEAGTIFGLLGANGAGKSTAVKILTTLSRADSGEARVAGLDVVRDAERVRRSIGVVGQKPGLDPDATGRENLEMQAELYGLTRTVRRERVTELLERLGLAEAARRLAKTYSGGMQRRLDIALGLVHRPKVLFLDEPTTGLDPEARAELWREIERLAGDEEMTILLTTHYLEEADRLASELVIVDRGRVVAQGSPDDLKSELHGDTVQVELAESASAGAAAGVLAISGLTELAVEGRLVRARAVNGAAAIPSLITALEQSGLPVASATIARPSLDEVYLRHAGRSFRQADTGTNQEARERVAA
jgi:ABC-2 type transport system ATP-binding protein